MIQDIFIIDAKNDNPCIFYGQIEQSPQPPNLAEILSMFIQKSSALSPGKSDTSQTGQGKFLFSNFEKIYVILKVLPSGEMSFAEKFIKNIAEHFIQKYGKDLETYGGDVSVFAGFSEIAAEIYSDLQEMGKKKAEAPAAEVPAIPSVSKELASKPAGAKGEEICPECKKGNPAGSTFCLECGAELGGTTKVAPPIKPSKPTAAPSAAPAKATDFMRAPEPIKFTPQKVPTRETGAQTTKPMKREAYPDGIPEYSRDEILWNESQSVMNEYSAEFVEDSVSKLSITLSISLQHHYTFEIDFTNYPERPTITITQGLQDEIGESLNDALSFMKAWDPKIPPHIIEIVRELEALFTKLKTQGKLTATAEMPVTALPDLVPLTPLPKLTPEEEARLKKYEAQKKAEKVAAEKDAAKKGTEAKPASVPAGKTAVPCPACKHVNPPGSAFCMGCGKKFEALAAKPPAVDKKELKLLEKEKKLQEKQKVKDDKQKEKADKQKPKPEKAKEQPNKKEDAKSGKEPEEEPAAEEEEPEEENEDE